MTPTVVTAAPLRPLQLLSDVIPPAVVAEVVGLTQEEQARLRWLLEARPEQLTPADDWLVWLVLAGRGWGKTRVGAEDTADWLTTHPDGRLAIVAPTSAAGKKVCVEGESGLLAVLGGSAADLPDCVDRWNRSEGLLLLHNGAQAQVYSSEEPERLRGPQHHRAWCDELAAWVRLQETWDMLLFGLRLQYEEEQPRAVVTTTPKPYPLIRDLQARETSHVTRGRMRDNAENLSRAAVEELERRYGGTTLGRQELDGEVLEDAEGAMWTRGLVERTRLPFEDRDRVDLDLARRVTVAVDPAVTSGEESDETGVVVVVTTSFCPCGQATDEEPHALVLEDASGRRPAAGADGWPYWVVARYEAWGADHVVAEVNNGGDLVEEVVRAAHERHPGALPLSYRKVVASRGKRPRAEPVVTLFERGRVHLVGAFPQLEDQMCTWTGSGKSPDRMDAMVWGVTDALLRKPRRRGTGGLRT